MFGGKGLGYGGNASVLAIAWSCDGDTLWVVTLDVKLCSIDFCILSVSVPCVCVCEH